MRMVSQTLASLRLLLWCLSPQNPLRDLSTLCSSPRGHPWISRCYILTSPAWEIPMCYYIWSSYPCSSLVLWERGRSRGRTMSGWVIAATSLIAQWPLLGMTLLASHRSWIWVCRFGETNKSSRMASWSTSHLLLRLPRQQSTSLLDNLEMHILHWCSPHYRSVLVIASHSSNLEFVHWVAYTRNPPIQSSTHSSTHRHLSDCHHRSTVSCSYVWWELGSRYHLHSCHHT
jgi:hypothetical protein